jgi:hypothetical protein
VRTIPRALEPLGALESCDTGGLRGVAKTHTMYKQARIIRGLATVLGSRATLTAIGVL